MDDRIRKIIPILFFLFSGGPVFPQGGIVLSDTEWNFGAVRQGEVIKKTLAVTNNSGNAVSVQVIPTCDCLFAEPEELAVIPRGTGRVELIFDTKEYQGEVETAYIIRANAPDFKDIYFLVRGVITPVHEDSGGMNRTDEEKAAGKVPARGERKQIELYYYYSAGCKHCVLFLEKTIPGLEKRLGISISVTARDIFNPAYFEEFNRKIERIGEKAKAFPALIIGKTVLQGEAEIDREIERKLRKQLLPDGEELDGKGKESTPVRDGEAEALAIIPVIFAGLLDGINPCAFSTLIFLLAYLAYAGKKKRDILVIGIFYTVTVFLSYYLIGLGFFRALRLADAFPLITVIIEIILVGVLVVFAGISLYDYILIKKGRTKDIVLQLPDSFKQRIRKSIRESAKSTAIIFSAIVLGFLVSVFELACTGQIYFPTIAYLIQMGTDVSAFFFLGVYNVGFILPLLVVFVLTYKGLSSERLSAVFQRHMAVVKLVTAIFFSVMAVIVVLF